MHDWTLISICLEWSSGTLNVIFFDEKSNRRTLKAEGIRSLIIPRLEEWGESVSVNEAVGPKHLQDGDRYFRIEMQSGDNIEIRAKLISMP